MTVFDYIQGNTKWFWWMETFPSTKTTLVGRERLKLIIRELIYSRIDISLSRPRWFWWMASNADPFHQGSEQPRSQGPFSTFEVERGPWERGWVANRPFYVSIR